MSVKETKDVLNVIRVIAIAVIEEIRRDGYQWTDLGAFLGSPEFESAVTDAASGIEQVPLELATMGFLDTIEIGRATYDVVHDILKSLK
jgi:hypothetical protein